jgi:hypothetical protein
MGSTRLQALGMILMVASMINAKSIEIGATHKHVADIKAWASTSYKGGASLYEFSNQEKEVVVIVGRPTIGFVSSEVTFFVKLRDGSFRLILFRDLILKKLTPKSDKENVKLIDNDGKCFLIVPWVGVVAGGEMPIE